MAYLMSREATLELDLDIEAPIYDVMSKRRENISNSMTLCRLYVKGQCQEGDKCLHRHSKGQKSLVCKHWLRGLCKKMDDCEFLHEYNFAKMPPCQFWKDFGKCSNNEECHFRHITDDRQKNDCPWYDRGFCKHGAGCRNRHKRRQACPDYLAGFCLKGPDCDFAHPTFELPLLGDLKEADQELTDEDRQRAGYRPLSEVLCFKCGQMGHYAHKCKNPKKLEPLNHSRGGGQAPLRHGPNGSGYSDRQNDRGGLSSHGSNGSNGSGYKREGGYPR